jgi:hypothetical protein
VAIWLLSYRYMHSLQISLLTSITSSADYSLLLRYLPLIPEWEEAARLKACGFLR